MKAPQSQARNRGSVSSAVLLSCSGLSTANKEESSWAGSGAAASDPTSRLHYLSLHSAPFYLFFNGFLPRSRQERRTQYRCFTQRALQVLNLF